MTVTEKTQAALADYLAAKTKRREQQKTIRDLEASDELLTELKVAKKDAADAYKAEKSQFEGRHAAAFETLDELKNAEDEAHALFTDLYAQCLSEPAVQLSLFDHDGRKVSVELKTKIQVEKEEPADNARKEVERGLEDVKEGRMHGPYNSVEDMVADLET